MPRRREVPCSYFHECGNEAECECQGKGVCKQCARTMPGVKYPLRRGNAPEGHSGRRKPSTDEQE